MFRLFGRLFARKPLLGLSAVLVAAIVAVALVAYQFPESRHWATSALVANTHLGETFTR